jgi:hypothetical protein
VSGDTSASGARTALQGESIAQRSRRPQRGMIETEAVSEAVSGDTSASGARTALQGESIAQRSRRPQRE